MKCQTKTYGKPCNLEASWWISGSFIAPHPTCNFHKAAWMGLPETDPDKIPPPVATPIDNTNDGCH